MGNKSFKASLASEGRSPCQAMASMSALFSEEADFRDLLPGNYAIEGAVLGRGSDAVVLEVEEQLTKERLAVKVIRLPQGKDCRSKFRRMNLLTAIEREKETLRVLSHNNIVKLHRVYEVNDTTALFLELARGPSLARMLIDRGTLDEQSTRSIMRGLVSAVQHMHDLQIVHRDLKPENIMFKSDSNFDILLIDFGYATSCKGDTLGETLGTPNYLAPELCKYLPYGKGVDVWAIGVLLFISLFGRFPFHHCCQNELFKVISRGTYTFDTSPPVSSLAKSLIQSILVVNPKERHDIHQVASHPWMMNADKLILTALGGSLETSCASSLSSEN